MAMYADEYSDPYEAQKQKALTRPTAPAPAAPTNFPPPPTGGYTGRGAGRGCGENPVDPNKGGGGAGGAGGGGAAGAGGPQPSGGGDPSGISGQMEGVLKGMLAGGTSRYSPEAMQGLLAQIKQRIESSKGTQLGQAEAAAAGP